MVLFHLLLRQDNLNNDQNLYLQTIRKSSAHLLALINDVLDFSKIDAGKLELDTATFDLEEAILMLWICCLLLLHKSISIWPFTMPTMCQSMWLEMPYASKQILTNLISNAIKFTPDGEIIVRARMEQDDIGQCLLHFSVQDSGIGPSGTDRKNCLSLSRKVMLRSRVNLGYRSRLSDFQTAGAFDAGANWI